MSSEISIAAKREIIGDKITRRLQDRYPGIDFSRYDVDIPRGTIGGRVVGIANAAFFAMTSYLVELPYMPICSEPSADPNVISPATTDENATPIS